MCMYMNLKHDWDVWLTISSVFFIEEKLLGVVSYTELLQQYLSKLDTHIEKHRTSNLDQTHSAMVLTRRVTASIHTSLIVVKLLMCTSLLVSVGR